MVWIVDNSNDIVVDSNHLQARRNYIQRVTGVEVSDWDLINISGRIRERYLYCISNDGIEGTFITAHIEDVYKLCTLKAICMGKFVIANTCIWEYMNDKRILNNMRKFNQEIVLWFAKQELLKDDNMILRETATLKDIGTFGFLTSLSERELFKNRKKGFMKAIELSFNRVSTIIL